MFGSWMRGDRMKAQPISTAPSGRFVLIKHKEFGWLEAMFDPAVYAQSIQQHGEPGVFGWTNAALDNWIFLTDISAWAELPEEEETNE